MKETKRQNYHVVYVTGAPATGKTTLVTHLEKQADHLEVFSYGNELTKFLEKKGHKGLVQTELRAKSSRIASPADIRELDAQLLRRANVARKKSHFLVDSHAVTKESYGFRTTPFSSKQVTKLRPSMIFVLYAEPKVILSRIAKDSQGRPSISEEEATMHNQLQGAVAISYATMLGIPAYFLNSDRPVLELAHEITRRLAR